MCFGKNPDPPPQENHMPKLDFWYEFASTYSYLAAMRIGGMARAAGVEVIWRPFMLGPVFAAQGFDTSPFNVFLDKGAYMWRDMDRICAARGLPLTPPDPFPQNGLYAARLALIGAQEGWAEDFTKAVYTAEFGGAVQISDKQALAKLLSDIGQDGEDLLARIEDKTIKDALKKQTEQALGLGIFGAPTFITESDEMFWGDDRLEQALAWAMGKG